MYKYTEIGQRMNKIIDDIDKFLRSKNLVIAAKVVSALEAICLNTIWVTYDACD